VPGRDDRPPAPHGADVSTGVTVTAPLSGRPASRRRLVPLPVASLTRRDQRADDVRRRLHEAVQRRLEAVLGPEHEEAGAQLRRLLAELRHP